jgi:hypothetical protein
MTIFCHLYEKCINSLLFVTIDEVFSIDGTTSGRTISFFEEIFQHGKRAAAIKASNFFRFLNANV